MESEKVVVFQDENEEHTWWVFESDSEDWHEAKKTLFMGPMAKSRAEEYVSLLTLRRRMEDRDAISSIIFNAIIGNPSERPVKNASQDVADAIIKYLTEGKDGE